MSYSIRSQRWGNLPPVRRTLGKTFLPTRQVTSLTIGSQGETMQGFSRSWIIEFAGANSYDWKVEFTRVYSQYYILEFAQAIPNNWILAEGFLSEMIFLDCTNRFFSFKEHRTDMFKLTGTHRLVIYKYHQIVTKWHQVPYVLE